MKIKFERAKVAKITAEKEVGSKGNTVRTIILEMGEDNQGNPRIYPIKVFGKKVQDLMPDNRLVGSLVEVEAFVNSREYNGNYYTDLDLGSMQLLEETSNSAPQPSAATSDNGDDDLPF